MQTYYVHRVVFLLKMLSIKIKYRNNIETALRQSIEPSVRISIRNGSKIIMPTRNNSVTIKARGSLSATDGGIITIGDTVFFNDNCMVCCKERIEIGDRCIFGPNVVIYDHNHAFNKENGILEHYNTAPVIIERGTWVGANVTILKGARIGKQCVIGAGAVITEDIPDYSIVTTERKLKIKEMG